MRSANRLSQEFTSRFRFAAPSAASATSPPDVFSHALFDRYVGQVCAEIEAAESIATAARRRVRAVAWTPSTLAGARLRCSLPISCSACFTLCARTFDVERAAEITVECAPGTITDDVIGTLLELRSESRQPGRAVVRGQGIVRRSAGCIRARSRWMTSRGCEPPASATSASI